MLSDEERKKLGALNHLVHEQGKDLSREQVKWLLARLRASLSRPDEFDFPEYAALINPQEKNAFALRRYLKPNWSAPSSLEASAGKVEVLDVSAECPRTNAFMLIRPWIRMSGQAEDEDFEKLRLSSVELTSDGVVLLSDSPIDDFLIANDGGGMRGFSPTVRAPNDYVYPAVELNPGDATADPMRPLGIFLPDQTRVRLFIKTSAKQGEWKARIIAGLTVMEYTTKPGSGAGQDVAIPRDFSKIGG